MTRVYEEFVDFIAGGSSPNSVAAFRPSEQARARVIDLIRREKEGSLSADEASELAHYLHFEHLMRLAKARARLRLSGQPGHE
jgi:hypothetical protein